jgi:hypothetical protein
MVDFDGRKRSDCPRVLLSEGSSSSARQTLYGLGQRHLIGVVDPAPFCLCRFSSLVKRYHRSPSYSREPREYLAFLVRTIRSQGYDVLFPTHEQAYLLARFQDALAAEVGLALPGFETLRRLQNKANFVRLLDELGIPQPPTRIVVSLNELDTSWDYPCYIKLPHSTAGHGVRQVFGVEDVRRVAEEFERAGRLEGVSEIVVQQPAAGHRCVVQAVFQHGRLVGVHCAEAISLGIGGSQWLRQSASHPTVVEDVRRLGERVGWHGAMFLDYFYDHATGRAEYIEANPRIGETVNAMLCGVNLADLVVRISLGEEVEAVGPGKVGVRSHVGFLGLLSQAINGANRRQLGAEIWRMRTHRGHYQGSRDETTQPRQDWLSLIPATAITLQLLLCPASARNLVQRTVDNYSLPESAARHIEQLAEKCERQICG